MLFKHKRRRAEKKQTKICLLVKNADAERGSTERRSLYFMAATIRRKYFSYMKLLKTIDDSFQGSFCINKTEKEKQKRQVINLPFIIRRK